MCRFKWLKAVLTYQYCVWICAAINPEFYDAIEGYLCVNPQFMETHDDAKYEFTCGFQCNCNPRCQAFTMADGPCRLFVFDACSKSVRDCSCSRRGQLFVKKRPGLEPGALCPTGYGDDLCGVKYRLYSDAKDYWWPSRRRCEAESGLVIMADVVDAAEMDHVDWIYNSRSVGNNFWLGGYQTPGSVETRGGWYWVGCNITLDDSLWDTTVPEPNNGGTTGENVVARTYFHTKLSDYWESDAPFSVLCECVSPFT